jgi:hypothetical protein
MKYVYVTLGAVSLLAAASWVYLENIHIEPVSETTAADTLPDRTVAVMPLSADVSLGGVTEAGLWNVIATTSVAKDGTKVKTSADGRAIVSTDKDIISSLDNNSEMTIELGVDKKQSRLAIVSGSVWSKVARALEQDEVFEVYTPTMVAAVRGTSFGVSLNPKRSLIVTEGIVWVTRRNPETGERVDSSTFEVPAGNTVEDDGKDFVVRPTTSADKDQWYFLNNPAPEDSGAVSILDRFVPPAATIPAPASDSAPSNPVSAQTPSISSVSPQRFDPKTLDKVRVSGEYLSAVTQVWLNDKAVEFLVTQTGVLVIDTDEFRDGYNTYDLKITSPAGTATKGNAFVLEEEEIDLVITSAVFDYGQSQTPYIYVRGPGMGAVDTVLINNQTASFEIVSDTELRVAYPYMETTTNVEVRVGGQSAQSTVSL